MEKTKNIKILLGLIYCFIVLLFLWYFFNNFSLDEVSSYEFIKNNRNSLIDFKKNNFLIITIIFFILTVIWVMLLGFGSPIGLLSGFIYGKWYGTLIAAFSLTVGATLLYLFANFFLKELIKEKFEKRFYSLIEKFKKNEFFYLIIYRFIGIPFSLSNILPILFKIKITNFFVSTFFGILPSIYIITSLGSGLEKIINQNVEPPSLIELITSQEIYFPIIGFLFLLLITFLIKKKY